jgi:hypothetical protein
VIDLGAVYALSSISLFNTHNQENTDRGTNQFEIDASNSATFVDADVDFDLSGSISNIVANNLTFHSTSVPEQTFGVSGSFQYLRFTTLSFCTSCQVNSNGGAGLNEIRVFGTVPPSPVPEAGTLALLGIGLLGLRFNRRKKT